MTTGPVRDRRIPDLMSITEVAYALGLSRRGVQKMIDSGRLPAAQVGTTWVIRRAVVEALTVGT